MTEVAEPKVNVTPSGIEVLYALEPKRHYKVRDVNACDVTHPDHPNDGWVEVPSVTTVLDCLNKPGLPWWGMRMGVQGTLAMHNMGLLRSLDIETAGQTQKVLCYEGEFGQWHAAGTPEIEELLTKHRLTVNHVRDTAGDRGQSVHDAFEAWAATGVLPVQEIYPPEEQGYVLGLIEFLNATKLVPEASEVMVGSLEHGFAGRYDLRARVPEECQVVFHRTPKRGPQYATLKPGTGLIDLKTSKGIYETHAMQLEGYEIASVEDGYGPTDFRGILHVGPEGTYEFVRSWAVAEDFLAVLGTHRAFEAMKLRKKGEK
jgi:hypothetical protein